MQKFEKYKILFQSKMRSIAHFVTIIPSFDMALIVILSRDLIYSRSNKSTGKTILDKLKTLLNGDVVVVDVAAGAFLLEEEKRLVS